MPRSSFSHNPLLKVSRPVSACSRCRAAKVKCDGKLPACTACEKAGRETECSAANDQFARGKERSYVAALELRIEKLERRLQYAKTRKASLGFQEPDLPASAPADRRDSMAVIRAAIHRKAARTRETSDVNSLMSDFGFLSVSANTRDFEPSASMTFARLVLAATKLEPLPDATEFELPQRHVALALVRFYMTNIYSLYPCSSETALHNILNDIYQQDERVVKHSDYFLFFLVLGIGSTAQSQGSHDEAYTNGLMFVSKAMQYADGALVPGYVTQIQSFLLLTQYSLLNPTHFDSWHLIGFTTRAIVDLGLHQDPPAGSVPDKTVQDLRRKIFWSAYSLDRSVSMVLARTFSFTDSSINVAFPSPSTKDAAKQQPITGPQSSDPSLLLFSLRRAQSCWYQDLYQSHVQIPDQTSMIWKMCHDMREWGESLPSNLSPATRQMFDQELRYSYVYCIASSKGMGTTDYQRMLIFEYALTYLDAMHDLVIAKGGLNSAFYSYMDALKVYFMASQLVGVLWEIQDLILSGQRVPVPATRPGEAPPPPIPRRHLTPGMPMEDNLHRSLRCLERTTQTLAKFGERWERSNLLMGGFEGMSRDVVERLRQRDQQQQQQQRQQGVYQNGSSMGLPGQQPPQREVRWVGVDVAQMMRGGGPQ